MSVVTKEKVEPRVERELKILIGKLKRWAQEIEVHHEEIAKRNFAIGLEIAGFVESFPPRSFPGMDLMGRISEAVGFTPGYLSLLSRIADWLYRRNVKDIIGYMRRHKLHNWSMIIEHYFIAQGRSQSQMMLNRRWLGAKSSLTNLRAALPRTERPVIDRMLGRIDRIVKPRLRIER